MRIVHKAYGPRGHGIAVAAAIHKSRRGHRIEQHDGVSRTDISAASALYAVGGTMRHAQRPIGIVEPRDGGRRAEGGAHAARHAFRTVNDDSAPQTGRKLAVLWLPQLCQRVQQALTAIGDKMRQRTVFHDTKGARRAICHFRRRSFRRDGLLPALGRRIESALQQLIGAWSAGRTKVCPSGKLSDESASSRIGGQARSRAKWAARAAAAAGASAP